MTLSSQPSISKVRASAVHDDGFVDLVSHRRAEVGRLTGLRRYTQQGFKVSQCCGKTWGVLPMQFGVRVATEVERAPDIVSPVASSAMKAASPS
jgi:hypothetical protein